MGDLCARGIGGPADADAARAWFEKAAAQGNGPAQAKLEGLAGSKPASEPAPAAPPLSYVQ
jgi:TPR repeat protein